MTIMKEAALLALLIISAPLLPAEAFFVSPAATAAFKGAAATPLTRTWTAMKVTGIESTPNPSSFKFTLDQCLGNQAGSTWSASTADGAPELLRPVLELTGVESVYALSDWLCINKKPSAKWDAIVPAAVEALGGAADSLDPLTLLMASGGDGGSSWQRSEMDGIAVRLQVSNGIPIQVEACPPGGTPLRRKLSSRFVDAMTEFVGGSGDEMAFFKGRQWIPRGVRYPTMSGGEEGGQDGGPGGSGGSTEPSTGTRTATAAESAEEALDAAVEEVELAYHESRLRGAVQAALTQLQKSAEAAAAAAVSAGGEEDRTAAAGAAAESAAAAQAAVRAAAATLRCPSAEKGEIVGAVDALCAVAENDADAVAAAAKDALDALIGFAASGDGPVAARRAAVAYVGGAGDAAGSAGLEAVAAVFRGDKNPGVRRTAGDALSDLGDPDAIPIAVAGLHDKSKLVRWRSARVVGELGSREQEAVSLDEAREGEMEFEVAFEMSDAARKIRARVSAGGGEGEGGAVAGVGPVWKQIQERGASK